MEFETVQRIAEIFEVQPQKLMEAYEQRELFFGYVCCPEEALRSLAIGLRPSGQKEGRISAIEVVRERPAAEPPRYDEIEICSRRRSLPVGYLVGLASKLVG